MVFATYRKQIGRARYGSVVATTSYDRRDTSIEAQSMLDARFVAMSSAERATVAEQLSSACTALAIAGIRAANPALSEADLAYHLALRRYGRQLADEVYRPPQAP